MAKRTLLLLLVVLPFMSLQGQSCCNAGGLASCGSTGLLTGLRTNSASFRLMQVPFATTAAATGDEENYRDDFYAAEWAFRYQITPRWKVMLQQPYRVNVRKFPARSETLHGLADTRLTGSYAVFDNASLGSNSLIYWELGASVKLPTGKYDETIYYRDLPGNLNLGMGNMGYLFSTNLVFFKSKYGLGLNAGYQLNAKSRDGYHFGDQFTGGLSLFREFAWGENWKFVPLVGSMTEQFGKNHLPSGRFAEGSGGYGWLANVGLNVRYGAFQAGLSAARPFGQNYSAGTIVAKQRYAFDCTYFF